MSFYPPEIEARSEIFPKAFSGNPSGAPVLRFFSTAISPEIPRNFFWYPPQILSEILPKFTSSFFWDFASGLPSEIFEDFHLRFLQDFVFFYEETQTPPEGLSTIPPEIFPGVYSLIHCDIFPGIPAWISPEVSSETLPRIFWDSSSNSGFIKNSFWDSSRNSLYSFSDVSSVIFFFQKFLRGFPKEC